MPVVAGPPRPAVAPAERRRRRAHSVPPWPGPVRATRGARAELGDAGLSPAADHDGRRRGGKEGHGGHDPEGERACLAAPGQGPGDGDLQIVQLGPDPVLPVQLRRADQFGPGPLGERRIVPGVRALQRALVGSRQLLPGVGPHRLQQPVAAGLVRPLLPHDQGLAHQRRQVVQDVPPRQAARAGHRDRRGSVEASRGRPPGSRTRGGRPRRATRRTTPPWPAASAGGRRHRPGRGSAAGTAHPAERRSRLALAPPPGRRPARSPAGSRPAAGRSPRPRPR